MTPFRHLSALALASTLILVGCQFLPGATPNPTPTPSTSPISEADLEGCEHLSGGTGVAVTAVASGSTPAPTVNEPHKRYEIALPGQNEQYEGIVLYNSGEEADYVVFFDRDVPFKVFDAEANEVEIEESATSSVACSTIKGRHVVPLGIGEYTFHFGPTTMASVSMVIEETAHEENADH
jgi:hypothetical protein